MNNFDQKLKKIGELPLKVNTTDTFVVNFGLRKDPQSLYYYSEALPERMGDMPSKNADKLLHILEAHSEISLVEITGAGPERNPHFKHFVKRAADMGKKFAVVSNPATYAEPGMEGMPEFLAEHRVKILAFIPHYDRDIVDQYTGAGTYDKIVSSFKMLNNLGYSRDGSDLTTAFVYFPAEPEVVGDREELKKAFIKSYRDGHGIEFNHFIVFNTIPIGRFSQDKYMTALRKEFNPETLKNLPCRHALSIGSDGTLYDCDFMVAADRPVQCNSTNLDNFDYSLLKGREVATSDLCFICTAGQGATCADCFT